MGRFHKYRGALPAAMLIILAAVGSGTAPARTPAGALARTPAAAARTLGGAARGMYPARPYAARYPRGTVVRLHQHLVRVTIQNFAFQPAHLVVSPGTRIVWTNQDSDPHTVDGTKGLWASDALDTGEHFARVFKKPGTFAYYCSIHPFMHGTITVTK